MNTADQGVERQLADRDAHSSHALITDAQYALTVGNHNDVDLRMGPASQHVPNRVAQRIRYEQPAGSAVDMAEELATRCDYRCIDDGHHFINVLKNETIEEYLVRVLQRPQID